MLWLSAPVCALSLLSACDGLGPRLCDTGIVPAVTVTVVDARTGEPLAAEARGTVTDGAYQDSLRITRFDASDRATQLGAAFARPGTYVVVVERAGYTRWSASGVRTRSDGCHARAPDVRAALVPLP